MVAVDDDAFDHGSDERAVDRDIGRLPGRAQEDMTKAQQHRGRHHREIDEAGEPAARQEGVQIGVVRVFNEALVELKRADAERPVERKLRAKNVTAEAAERPDIVGLIEARALLEQVRHALGRQAAP